MKILEAKANFSGVETNAFFVELFFLLKMKEEFTAVDIVHDEVELFTSLERIVKVDKKLFTELNNN